MKCTRRPDLDPQTRIHIVMLAWLHQGVYGKMTAIAQYYQISRTLLSQLLLMANLQGETLLSDEKLLLQRDHRHGEHLLLLLRFEGHCSLLSIASILKALEYHPHSVGYLSQCFHSAAQALPSTLLMPSKSLVFSLSDEIFALHTPILVTIDARSTTVLTIELASDRSADTWRAHCEALEAHHVCSLGMASERGLGRVAGYRAACDMALWVVDDVHEFRDLFALQHHLERKASAAMTQEYDAAHKFDHAKSASNLAKRLQHYATAHHACQQAIALYDQLALLLHFLREAGQGCSPHGRLRTREDVRTALTLLGDMIEALDCAAMTTPLKPMHTHSAAIVVPFQHAEAIDAELRAVVPHDVGDCLVLAWHHDHLFSQSQSPPKRSHHRERACWLTCAEGLLGKAFDTLKALVFDTLDAIVRASSLVEMVNGLLRPSVKSCTGQITQEAFNLIMLYHHHHRYNSGKRQGKAPMELLTGKPGEAQWWELFLQQVNSNQDATDTGALPSRPPLHLMVNNDGRTDQRAIAPCRALVEHTGASEQERRQTVPQAASSFHLGWKLGRLESLTQMLRLCLHPAIPEV